MNNEHTHKTQSINMNILYFLRKTENRHIAEQLIHFIFHKLLTVVIVYKYLGTQRESTTKSINIKLDKKKTTTTKCKNHMPPQCCAEYSK